MVGEGGNANPLSPEPLGTSRYDREESTDRRGLIRGTVLVGTGRVVSETARVVKLLVLARLLSPADFGIAGVALIAVNTIDVFTQTGYEVALVQSQRDVRRLLGSARTFHAARGVAIAAAVAFTAPAIARFYELPALVEMLRLAALILAVRGLRNPGLTLLMRRLEFGRIQLLVASEALVSLVVTVAFAAATRSAWALLWGALAGEIVRAAGSFLVTSDRPKFMLERDALRELSSFGKWVYASNVVTLLSLQGDNLFVGKYLGAPALGLYQMAFRASDIALGGMSTVVGQVTLPALSQVTGDERALRQRYIQVLRRVALAGAVITPMVVLGAQFGIEPVLGKDWVPMVPALSILAVANFIRSIWSVASWGLYAAGDPRSNFLPSAMRLLTVTVLIVPLSSRFGIAGAAMAVLVSVVVGATLHVRTAGLVMGVLPRDYLRALRPSFSYRRADDVANQGGFR